MEGDLLDAGKAYVTRHRPTYTGLSHLLSCLLTTRLIKDKINADKASEKCPKKPRKSRASS